MESARGLRAEVERRTTCATHHAGKLIRWQGWQNRRIDTALDPMSAITVHLRCISQFQLGGKAFCSSNRCGVSPLYDSGLRFNKIWTISSDSRVPYTKTVCAIDTTSLAVWSLLRVTFWQPPVLAQRWQRLACGAGCNDLDKRTFTLHRGGEALCMPLAATRKP